MKTIIKIINHSFVKTISDERENDDGWEMVV